MYEIVRLIKICYGLLKGGGYNYIIRLNISLFYIFFYIFRVEF